MPNVNVTRIAESGDRSLPVFDELERTLDRIRARAYELFSERGHGLGRDLEDWLRAEREICWPSAELDETENDFVVAIAVPGFEAGEVELTVTPREIIVHAAHSAGSRGDSPAADARRVRWSEFRSNDVYRRIVLPSDVAIDKVAATLKNGLLKVVAPKAVRLPVRKVDVAA